MPVLFLVLILSFVAIDAGYDVSRDQQAASRVSQRYALRTNLLIVRNALQRYMQANPGLDGPVSMSALGLDVSFNPDRSIHALIDAGHGYVYMPMTWIRDDLETLLGEQPSALMGIAQGNQLVSPVTNHSISLPAVIPDQSIVLML